MPPSGAPEKKEDKRKPADADSSQAKAPETAQPSTTTSEPSTTTSEPSTTTSEPSTTTSESSTTTSEPSTTTSEPSTTTSEPSPKAEANPEPKRPEAAAQVPTTPAANVSNARLEALVAQARSMRSGDDAFPLVRTKDGLALLPDQNSSPLTNAEAIRTIDRRLTLNADLERAKASGGPLTVDDALDYEFLSANEVESLQMIRKELAQRPPSEKVDTRRFAEINDRLISNQRARVVADLDETVTRDLNTFGLRLIDTAEGLALDPASRAGLDVKLKDRANYSSTMAELQIKLTNYTEFLQKWGLRSPISPNEILVLNKVRVFANL